jgi:hypothetical protein
MLSTTKLATAAGAAVTDLRHAVAEFRPRERHARSQRKRVRWGRLGRRALYAVAIAIVAYLVAVNVLLKTRLFRNAISGSSVSFAISGRTSDLRLDYASAYSIIPGRVHLDGLTIRGRDQSVEWFLTLDHADVSVSLVDLLHRTFHASRLRASGFTIRARLRLDRVGATPEVVAALPPIAGFADPPLVDMGPPELPLTDASYNLWTVDLEDVDVEHVREVWIHTVRSEGDTRVHGRWLFRPQRWLDVGPATVDVNGVDISYGSHPLATGVRGSFGATVHPFDLWQRKGLDIFDNVSTSGQLNGRAIVNETLRLFASGRGVAFSRWEGPFDSRVVLDHGRLADGTRVRIDAKDCAIEAKGMAFEAAIRTDLGVHGGVGTLDTRVSGLRVSRSGMEQARVASIAAIVTSRHTRIAQAFDDARFALDVTGAETDVVAWRSYLPSASASIVRSSIVKAHGHAEGSIPGAWAIGVATITADDLGAQLGPALVAGKLAMHVDLRSGTWASRTFDLSGSDATFSAVSARTSGNAAPFLAVPALTVVAPRLVLAQAGLDGHVSIDLPAADLIDLGRLRELLPLPAWIVVESGRGRARVHADIEMGSGSASGEAEIVTHGMRARVGSTELFGDLDLALRARRSGGASGSTDLSGSTLAVTHAGTGSGAAPEDAWWGNVALREATLRTIGGVRFDARVHVAAKDASPATVLVAENTGVPTWAANIFRMPVLDADARMLLAPSSLEVGSFVARGAGSTSVRAEYARRDGRQDGAVLLDLGWIDLGYDLAEGSTGLVLLGPQAWYAGKTATLRDAALAARRKTDAAEQLIRYAAMGPLLRRAEARALAARCAVDVRSCDGASIENLISAAADARERDTLSGMMYAPMVVAAAKGGTDGSTLDPRVVGSVAEALRIGSVSTLDEVPTVTRLAAAGDPDAARGKVIAVAGRVSSVRTDGPCSVGTVTTDAGSVHFVTPFASPVAVEAMARFRGVFVQRYASADQAPGQPPSIVLVGAFSP